MEGEDTPGRMVDCLSVYQSTNVLLIAELKASVKGEAIPRSSDHVTSTVRNTCMTKFGPQVGEPGSMSADLNVKLALT